MSGKKSDIESPLGSHCVKRNTGVKSKTQKNQEYFQALEQWLNDVKSYTFSCNFFAGLPYSVMNQQGNSFPPVENPPGNFIPPAPFLNQNVGLFAMPRPEPAPPLLPPQGTEYRLAPLWKRFAAEYVDFLLLFLVRLVISFVAIDFFEFLYVDDFDVLQVKNNPDLLVTAKKSSGFGEIIFLEALHRIIVCMYEGVFLHRSSNNQIGGATPGKTLMGIKVVLCYSIQPSGNDVNTVKILPASNLGLGWSFARAILKNLILALLFPIFVPLFFNRFHRTGYDILCNSVVVEDRAE